MTTDKPTTAEDEYFARKEMERRKQVAEAHGRSVAADERERLRELHWMRCPKCGTELAEVTFREVRVDRCVACGGVWLDAGELEQVAGKEEGFLGGLLRTFRE